MLVCSWLLFFIISTTAATPQISQYLNPKKKLDRDMNITLKTVSEIDDKDNIEARENFKKLINKVKSNFNKSDHNFRASNFAPVNFSDFIQRLLTLLNKLDDNDLKDFFSIANAEIRNYHYKGCIFYELTENLELRKYIARILDTHNQKSAAEYRQKLQEIEEAFRDVNLSQHKKTFVDAINALYKDDSLEKMNRFLTNLDDYRRKARRNMDLVKITRSGIRTIIFDHYSKLNRPERIEFQSKVNDFWKNFVQVSNAMLLTFTSAVMKHLDKTKKTSTLTTNKKRFIKMKRKTSYPRTYKQQYVKNNFNSKYKSDVFDRSSQKSNLRNSKFHAAKSHKIGTSKHKLIIPFYDNEYYFETDHTVKPDPPKTTNQIAIQIITVRPYVSKNSLTSQKYKYEIIFKQHKDNVREPKLHLKKPEFQIKHNVHIRNPNEHFEMMAPAFHQSSVIYMDEEKKTTEKSLKSTRENKYWLFRATKKQRRVSKADTRSSNQKYLIPFRKSFDNISVLARLQYLEDELRLAQTQIKNDSKIIRELSNMMLANQKIDYDTENGNNEKNKFEEKKEVVIDLKINYEDLKKIVNLPYNEIKPDELKTALLNKLYQKNHNIIDSDINKHTIVRKFDFDQRLYNDSKRKYFYSGEEQIQRVRSDNTFIKDKTRESYSINKKNNTELSNGSSPKKSYLSDGDTYERQEERLYESDSNKDKIYSSDNNLMQIQTKKNDMTNPGENKNIFGTNRQLKNKYKVDDDDQKYNSHVTLKNEMELKIGRENQHDNLVKLGDVAKKKYEFDKLSYELNKTKNNNSNRYFNTKTMSRLHDDEYIKQHNVGNDYNKENVYTTHNYFTVTKGTDKIIKFDKNENSVKESSYNANIKQKLDSAFILDEKSNNFEYKALKQNTVDNSNSKLVPIKVRLTTNKPTNTQVEEIRLENENHKFIKTADPAEVLPKRFSTSKPVEKQNVISISATVNTLIPRTNIL